MWDEQDREQLSRRGITEAEAARQMGILGRPARRVTLIRPCTVGDGVVRLDPAAESELLAAHETAARDGRFTKFVPASGAASRMFRELLYFQRGAGRELSWIDIQRLSKTGDSRCGFLIEFMDSMQLFPFAEVLRSQLDRAGEELDALIHAGAFQPVLDGLLEDDRLHFAGQPKGLLPFHRVDDHARTAFEEHLIEAGETVGDADGRCRLHFTVSAEHRSAFEALLAEIAGEIGGRMQVRFDVGFSEQKPSTDTLSVDPAGQVVRDSDGRVVLRPGGHGALIENLNDLGADLVSIKNIDNVQTEARRATTVHWKKLLSGHLVLLQHRVHEYLRELQQPDPAASTLQAAEEFARNVLHIDSHEHHELESIQTRRVELITRLNRPLRVCGVVRNTGEPGGGPFWVRQSDGSSGLQIVETAEIDSAVEGQRAALHESTHFNPVDLVCGLRDATDRPFDLTKFVEPSGGMVCEKSEGGRDIRALERPGLWNGAMAGWITVFVEVPIETFTPVKTVMDLLRDEHQPG